MNTVTNLIPLEARVVSDQDEIDRLRWFQTNRYFDCGLLAELPTQLPEDPYVPHSTYFGVYRGDEIQATARIVNPPIRPEIFKYHDLFPEAAERFEQHARQVAEVSRLAVARDAPNYETLLFLCREFFHHGVRHPDGLLLLCSIGKPLIRILERLLGVPIEVIGPEISQYGDFEEHTIPALIDSMKCLEVTLNQSSRKWEFYQDGLVINLTNNLLENPTAEYASAAS